jgi:hypothetical protein
MKQILFVLLFATSCIFAKSAPKTHDGFFLNGVLGLGYGNYTEEYKNDGIKLQSEGSQIGLGIKVGAAIIQNFILHGNIEITTFAEDLKAETWDQEKIDNILEKDNFVKTMFLGGGVTYYLPSDLNIYLSASLGAVIYTEYYVEFLGKRKKLSTHDSSVGFILSFGKEWWVNNELGIGVAASYKQSSTNSKFLDYKGDTSFKAASIAVSLTFN